MRLTSEAIGRPSVSRGRVLTGLTLTGLALALTLCALSAGAQPKPADMKAADVKPAESQSNLTYLTLYLVNVTQQNEANDLQTDLRNMIPGAKLYYVPSENAISVRGTAEEVMLAQKVLGDLDRPKKTYRLTYTITETEGGKHTGTQHFALIVVPGGKAVFKQGNRMPIVTGTTDGGNLAQSSQVQYVDLGLNVEASLEGISDAVRLHTKIEQSGAAEEKSSVGIQDPVIRQTILEGTSILTRGKPVVLGSLDVPGSTRHQEVEVVAELVK